MYMYVHVDGRYSSKYSAHGHHMKSEIQDGHLLTWELSMWARSFRAGSLVDVLARLSLSLSKKSYEKKEIAEYKQWLCSEGPLSSHYGNCSTPYHNKWLMDAWVWVLIKTCQTKRCSYLLHFYPRCSETINKKVQCVVYTTTSFLFNAGSINWVHR